MFLTACGPVSGGKTTNAAAPSEKQRTESTALDYIYESLDPRGNICSTGPHRHDSLKSLCLNIQDEEQNNNCAKEERAKKFDLMCEPAGYSQLESLQCEFVLLNKNAIVTSEGTYAVDQLVASSKHCVGYQKDGSPDKLSLGSDLTLMTERGKNYVLKVEMNFSKEKDKSGQPTDATFEFYTEDSDTRTKVLMDPYSFRSDGPFKTRPTRDFRYRYLVKCVKTWAC